MIGFNEYKKNEKLVPETPILRDVGKRYRNADSWFDATQKRSDGKGEAIDAKSQSEPVFELPKKQESKTEIVGMRKVVRVVEDATEEWMKDLETQEDENKDGTAFRWRCQKGLFTYKTHIDKDMLEQFFFKLSKEKMKKIYISHETGSGKINYLHTHVVVDFGCDPDKKSCRFADVVTPEGEVIHPNMRKIIDKKGSRERWCKACTYLAKEDAECRDKLNLPDNWVDRMTDYQRIVGCSSLGEALSQFPLSSANNVIATYNAKRLDEIECSLEEKDFYPWQRQLVDMLDYRDDRKVTWIWEPRGKIGKSKLARWLAKNRKGECLCLTAIGKMADFNMNLANAAKDQGWTGNTLIINLVRSHEDRNTVYEAIEVAKDGSITCTKYNGGVLWLPEKMNVIIFANFYPKVANWNEDKRVWEPKLSYDRWNIKRISFIDNSLRSQQVVPGWNGRNKPERELELYGKQELDEVKFENDPTADGPDDDWKPAF